MSSEIGPGRATGVGWIFEYALVDRNGKHDLSELRFWDWFPKFELKPSRTWLRSPRLAACETVPDSGQSGKTVPVRYQPRPK